MRGTPSAVGVTSGDDTDIARERAVVRCSRMCFRMWSYPFGQTGERRRPDTSQGVLDRAKPRYHGRSASVEEVKIDRANAT